MPPQIEQVINGEKVPGWEIQPITENGVTYSIRMETQEDTLGHIIGQEMFVEATDANKKSLWKTPFYRNTFQSGLETDVQEVYPVDFLFGDNGRDLIAKLEHHDENNRIFRITKESGEIIEKSYLNDTPHI